MALRARMNTALERLNLLRKICKPFTAPKNVSASPAERQLSVVGRDILLFWHLLGSLAAGVQTLLFIRRLKPGGPAVLGQCGRMMPSILTKTKLLHLSALYRRSTISLLLYIGAISRIFIRLRSEG